MYDIIVLGAGFTAAGIAHKYKKRCLILEQGLQGDNDFYGALRFGTDFDRMPHQAEAIALREKFLEYPLYNRITLLYPYLQEADVLFGIRLVSAEKTEDGFVCQAYGIEGFCTFRAKQVIDTRCNEAISSEKTFNLLIESRKDPNFSDVTWEKGGMERHYILRLPIPLDQGYKEARQTVQKLVRQFQADQRLILSGSYFDYRVKQDYPKIENGIRRLPSAAYGNPVLAFEAGLEVTL